jgi:hypothetical protein
MNDKKVAVYRTVGIWVIKFIRGDPLRARINIKAHGAGTSVSFQIPLEDIDMFHHCVVDEKLR